MRDAVSYARFVAGMTLVAGVFVTVQALLLLEDAWDATVRGVLGAVRAPTPGA